MSENFHLWFALNEAPVALVPTGSDNHRYLVVRARPGALAQVETGLKAAWEDAFPELPYTAFRQADVFSDSFQSYRNVAEAFSYIAILALLIACMGLFGLATQNLARQRKEVSIRKVMGATVGHLAFRINRGFVFILIVAATVATGLTFAALTIPFTMLEVTIIHMPPGPLLYAAAYGLVFGTAALAVSVQSRQLIRADPAAVLRND